MIGEDIFVSVMSVSGHSVRLGIEGERAPIYREEIWQAVRDENRAAGSGEDEDSDPSPHRRATASPTTAVGPAPSPRPLRKSPPSDPSRAGSALPAGDQHVFTKITACS